MAGVVASQLRHVCSFAVKYSVQADLCTGLCMHRTYNKNLLTLCTVEKASLFGLHA